MVLHLKDLPISKGLPEYEGNGGWQDTSSKIQAAVAWYGAYDILKFENLLKDERFQLIYGGTLEEKRQLIWDTSPIKYVKDKLAPFLAMCDEADVNVPGSQSTEFCRMARDAGNDAESIAVPNQGHGYFTGDEYYEAIFRFFDKHLMGK